MGKVINSNRDAWLEFAPFCFSGTWYDQATNASVDIWFSWGSTGRSRTANVSGCVKIASVYPAAKSKCMSQNSFLCHKLRDLPLCPFHCNLLSRQGV
jgi:hypothetical protein